MLKILLLYVIAVNLAGLFFMRADKHKAKRGKYRIPERQLFGLAAAGGALGVLAGMRLFRHKTKHPTFYVGIPVILFLQLILLGYALPRLIGS